MVENIIKILYTFESLLTIFFLSCRRMPIAWCGVFPDNLMTSSELTQQFRACVRFCPNAAIAITVHPDYVQSVREFRLAVGAALCAWLAILAVVAMVY